MYEFCYDYIKPKHGEKAKLCYTDTDYFITHVKTEDCYKDHAPDLGKWLDTSGYIVDRPLPIGKNKKVLRKFKDELKIGVMTKIVGLRPKTYSFLINAFEEEKKNKGTKKSVVKRILKFNDCKDCLLNKKTILKSQQRFKSEAHDVYTEEVNKIVLRSNDDKRDWASYGIKSYPYGYKGKYTKQSCLSKVNIND